MAKLTFHSNTKSSLGFVLDNAAIRLGRDPANEVCLDHSWISSFHAVLQLHDGAVVLHDLESSNGTAVNGQTITRQVLKTGDVISFGPLEAVLDCAPTGHGTEREEGEPLAGHAAAQALVLVRTALAAARRQLAAAEGDLSSARTVRDALAEEAARHSAKALSACELAEQAEERLRAAGAELGPCRERLALLAYELASADQLLTERQRQCQQAEQEQALLLSQVNRWQGQAAAAARVAQALQTDEARLDAVRRELAAAAAPPSPAPGASPAGSGGPGGETVPAMARGLLLALERGGERDGGPPGAEAPWGALREALRGVLGAEP